MTAEWSKQQCALYCAGFQQGLDDGFHEVVYAPRVEDPDYEHGYSDGWEYDATGGGTER